MPAFDCEAQCQAPDSFFSGYPWAINPKGGPQSGRPGKKMSINILLVTGHCDFSCKKSIL